MDVGGCLYIDPDEEADLSSDTDYGDDPLDAGQWVF